MYTHIYIEREKERNYNNGTFSFVQTVNLY